MLAGIGGRTIAEAQENLSYIEFMQWLEYRKRYGSLTIATRIEEGIALLNATYANRHRREHSPPYSIDDFLSRPEREITEEEAMQEWK